MNRTALFALVVLVAGCVTGLHDMRSALPSNESAAFDACYSFTRARACPPEPGDRLGAYESTCMGGLASQYAGLPDARSRRDYLAQAGCPSPVLDQHLGR